MLCYVYVFVYERQDIEGMAQQRYEWDEMRWDEGEMKEEIIDETKWNENECIEETWHDLTWLDFLGTKRNKTTLWTLNLEKKDFCILVET